MRNSSFTPGSIVDNVQPATGRVLATVRVMAHLNIPGETLYRVCDARETRSDEWLIAHQRTWAAPAANLVRREGLARHVDGLVTFA